MIGYRWDYDNFFVVHERGPTNKHKSALHFRKFRYCPDCGKKIKWKN